MLVWSHLSEVQTVLPAMIAFKGMVLWLNRKADINNGEWLIFKESLWGYIMIYEFYSKSIGYILEKSSEMGV